MEQLQDELSGTQAELEAMREKQEASHNSDADEVALDREAMLADKEKELKASQSHNEQLEAKVSMMHADMHYSPPLATCRPTAL